MKKLRILLIAANALAVAVLLAIPAGKLSGAVGATVDTAAVFGWLIYFVPLLASALSLWGIQHSRPALTSRSVMIAMPGSFLVALLSLYTLWKGPSDFAQISMGTALLLGLNVLALWEPFKAHLRSPRAESMDTDGEA